MAITTFESATISAVNAMHVKAQALHPGRTLNEHEMPIRYKLSALAEEFGEVCTEFTYDKMCEPDEETWREKIVKELLQLAALSLAWVESIEHGGT